MPARINTPRNRQQRRRLAAADFFRRQQQKRKRRLIEPVPDPLRALIDTLFGNGERGAVYVPQPALLGDQNLWQMSDGTVIVDADGDPVGRNDDVSGNGNHATQSVSADRPLYKTDGSKHWLEGDGAGDYLEAGPIPWASSSTGEAYFAVAARRTGSVGYILTDSDTAASRITQSFSILDLGDGTIDFVVGGTLSPAISVPLDFILEIKFNKSTGDCSYRVNGGGWLSLTVGSYSDTENLRFFSRGGGVYWDGRMYGVVGRAGSISTTQSDDTKQFLAQRAGITL